ncbi:YceD family protein [Sphingomonas sp. ID0503]|uniref:YceD family protein n=1 Tax=Sphingomonas sp. ID0503 TaxID=3399691 RepID=UPI003AFB7B0D
MTPEFSRPVRIDTIGDAPRHLAIEADESERRRLAGRFRLVSLDVLSAEADVSRDAIGILAIGRIRASVVQSCVASGEPVPARIDAPFRLRFVADAVEGDEVELSEDDCDTVFYEGGEVDLGEAAAETLSLELDPFPRAPNAEAVLREAGVVSEDEATGGAFDALKALKDKLGK